LLFIVRVFRVFTAKFMFFFFKKKNQANFFVFVLR
jgi:hypothetical protein